MMNAARNASAVREPAVQDLEGFRSFKDTLVWAGIKGNPDVAYTQAGSLLVAIAGDEFQTMQPKNSRRSPRRTSRRL